MRLPRFRYYAPSTVKEAIRIKAGSGPEGSYVAGDLVVVKAQAVEDFGGVGF